MSTPKRESGEIEYLAEGYMLRWKESGVVIKATEYHATELRLSWDEIFELARRSGWRPPMSEGRQAGPHASQPGR